MRFATLKAENEECCSSHSCPCSKGRQQAFELYEKSLALNKKMSVNFEAERKVLAAFREGLKKVRAALHFGYLFFQAIFLRALTYTKHIPFQFQNVLLCAQMIDSREANLKALSEQLGKRSEALTAEQMAALREANSRAESEFQLRLG